MTATFDCPHCGAPLSFDPHPGDESVVCSFCGETVIIPQELRVPLPAPVVEPPAYERVPAPAPARRMSCFVLGLAIIGFVVVGLFLIGVATSFFQTIGDSPTDAASSDVGSATATVENQATRDALQTLLGLEQSWPAIFSENFADNSHQWLTGDVRDGHLTGNRSISSGTYTWNMTAVQGTSDFSFPNLPAQKDFMASVDLKLIDMPDDPDTDAGLAFRFNNSDQSWYYFSINKQNQYYFGWYDGANWTSLISDTASAAIRPGQTNRLTVSVQGSQFIFLINGQMVDHFIDDHQKSGGIGVGINLTQAGEKASVGFSNFTVSAAGQ